jgi:hypothetical protein
VLNYLSTGTTLPFLPFIFRNGIRFATLDLHVQ